MSVQAAEQRYRAHRIMNDPRMNTRGRCVALWNYVLTNELQNGTQFLMAVPGGQLYAALGHNNQVIPLPRSGRGGDGWHSYFHTVYGFSEREKPAAFVYDALRSYVVSHGSKVELRRFAAYNAQTQTAYLSGYNGMMWKVDGSASITNVPNGEDNTFFADDDAGVHVEPDIGHHNLLVEWLTNINFAPSGLAGITPEQQKMAFVIWMFAVGLPDLMPTKPILLLEGTKGSGKSASAMLLQLALMGMSRPMILQKNKEDDFGVVLLRSPIALFDNTDSYIEWVPDAICAYTTSGVWNKRKLFTDDESLVIKPHAFIVVSTRNPASFRRDDVADRCVILRLERRISFVSFQQLQQNVVSNRPQLFGEYLWYLGQIVDGIRAQADHTDEQETHRMADYAALGRVVGTVMGWEPKAVSDLMLALQGERDAFINEEDPLIDLLQKWVGYKPRMGPANIGRTVTVFELHSELETLAGAANLMWKDSPRTLAQKIRSTHIERAFHIEQLAVGGHKAFRIWRQSDPRLEIVGA